MQLKNNKDSHKKVIIQSMSNEDDEELELEELKKKRLNDEIHVRYI